MILKNILAFGVAYEGSAIPLLRIIPLSLFFPDAGNVQRYLPMPCRCRLINCGAVVNSDDLTPEEQDGFISAVFAEGRKFGCVSDKDFMLFSTPCAIYGTLSHRDPMFQPIFYSEIPWPIACLRRSPEAMIDVLARVLDVEFAKKIGNRPDHRGRSMDV